MGTLAILGKSCGLTKAYLGDKKEILEGKVKPAGGSKYRCRRAGVKGKRTAVCDFVPSHAGKIPLLSFCITSLACNPFYLVQTLSLCLVSIPIQSPALKIIYLGLAR